MTSTPPAATLSHYRLIELLGRGGMGDVWLAEDTELPRRVAVKLLPAHLADNREAVERLLHEARAVARVEHPNVVTVYEAGVADGRAFLVLQRVEGETLEERLGRGRLDVAEAVALGLALADALAEVHALGIVHRDLKPANIVLSARGPKILDFGIASMLGAPRLTSTGHSVGTPVAMAPEQFRGQPADNRSDLWSLGVILYRVLTGSGPFEGASYEAVLHGVLNHQPPPPSAAVRGLPTDLDFIVMKLLRKDPDRRYARADELIADLSNVAAELATGTTGGARSATEPAAPQIVRLAVLPFELMSAEADDAFLADGLVEDLIVDLAHLEGMRVSPRADVLAYRNRAVPPRTVARELGVDHVVLGSVRRAGARARISAQLLRAADGHVQWADRFDRTLDDLFEVQAEISRRIADALQVALRPGERERLERAPTQNAEAYTLYLRARSLLDTGVLADNRRAESLLQQALELDPTFARALGALAECHSVRDFRYWVDERDSERALEYATRSLELDPGLPEPHVARAHVAMMRGDAKMVREAVARILEHYPDHPEAIEYVTFAAMSSDAVEVERLIPALERAVERFPDRYRSASNLMDCYTLLGREEDARRAQKITLERTIEHVRRHPEEGHARSLLAVTLARQGRADEAIAQILRARATTTDDMRVWYNHVCVLSILGRTDEALEEFTQRARGFAPYRREWPERDPDLENLRRHPGFARFLNSANRGG